ncbi:MFS transporter [Lentzea aerocolonigenes]|uniref:MFS transporter n=1 Tax=Lentzea aerocolonigenes TaxID=68170 RepID=UPI000AF548AD|nr:MFS transporter [Lentzea aerocolonigenes]
MAACFFMEQLDATIVSTAAPRLGPALGVPPADISLLVSVYLLAVVVLLPLSGWLSARWGARRVFLTAIAVFTAASLACATSTSLGGLVVARVVQGAGGSMMVPIGLLVVLGTARKADIPRLLSYVVWPGLLAPVAAPALGGVITTYWHWRWIFLINVPLGLVALALAWRLVRPARPSAAAPRLDLPGVLLLGLGLGAVTTAEHLMTSASGPVVAAAVAVTGVTALTAATRHLLRSSHPLVDLRTLRTPTFRVAVIGSLLFGALVAAVPFLLPQLFSSFGWTPAQSGALVLFVFAGNIGVKPATTWLVRHVPFRRLIAVPAVCLAATAAGFALLTPSTPLPVVIGLAVVSGCARSVGLTAYSTLAFSDVPPPQMQHCNTLLAMAQQMSGVLGVSAAAAALHLGEAAAFLVLAGAGLVAAAHALRLHPAAGNAVRAG